MSEPPPTYAFVFVCQQGRLEIESLLLAASLSHSLRCDYELIAAIPMPLEALGQPRDTTLRQLEQRGVRLEWVVNELIAAGPPPQNAWYLKFANKIYSLRVPTSADKLVFIDSDHLCPAEYDPRKDFPLPLTLRQLDIASAVCLDPSWPAVYEACDQTMPSLRFRVEGIFEDTFYRRFIPPAFNSSLIGLDRSLAPGFSQVWEDCLRRIDAARAVENVYHTEQAALAIAVQKSGRVHELRNLHDSCRQLIHYVRPEIMQQIDGLVPLAQSLAAEFEGLEPLVAELPEWRFLLDPSVPPGPPA